MPGAGAQLGLGKPAQQLELLLQLRRRPALADCATGRQRRASFRTNIRAKLLMAEIDYKGFLVDFAVAPKPLMRRRSR